MNIGKSYFWTLLSCEIYSVFAFIKHIQNRFLKKLCFVLLSPLLFPVALYKFLIFTIPYVEVVITPSCNLNCKGCANFMPLYQLKKSVSTEQIKQTVSALLSVSGRVDVLKLIGGEPFLHPELSELLTFVLGNPKVKKVMLTTNGSIVPSEQVLNVMSNKRVHVIISDYPTVNHTCMIEALEKYGVSFTLLKFENWEDYGGAELRKLSESELTKSYALCSAASCKTLYGNKLFSCPRSAHGDFLNLFEESPENSPVICGVSAKELKQNIKRLYKTKYLTACDYCNPPWAREEIECGVQIPKKPQTPLTNSTEV